MGDWKAVRSKPNAPLELYDLKQDIGETSNVAAQDLNGMERIETASRPPPPEPESEWHF